MSKIRFAIGSHRYGGPRGTVEYVGKPAKSWTNSLKIPKGDKKKLLVEKANRLEPMNDFQRRAYIRRLQASDNPDDKLLLEKIFSRARSKKYANP